VAPTVVSALARFNQYGGERKQSEHRVGSGLLWRDDLIGAQEPSDLS
jgi:hypothetical protein